MHRSHVYVSTKLKNYFSFKRRYSVSSMGFIGSNKTFLWAAVGAPGSVHDSRLLKSCDLFAEICFPKYRAANKGVRKQTNDNGW